MSRFAIPCFFIISGYFFYVTWAKTSDKFKIIKDRSIRIIPIFLFWALVYSAVPPLLKAGTMEHLAGIIRYPHSFIFTGGVYHLWFLSSLLQGYLILWVALRYNLMVVALVCGFVLFALALFGSTYSMSPLGYSVAFDMKNGPFFSTVFVILGACMAQGRLSFTSLQSWLLIASGCLVCVSEVIILQTFFQVPFESPSMLLGLLPLAVGITSLAIKNYFPVGILAVFGSYSLGIYLIHPLLIEALKLCDLPFAGAYLLLFIPLVALSSLLITWSVAKIPYVRRVIH